MNPNAPSQNLQNEFETLKSSLSGAAQLSIGGKAISRTQLPGFFLDDEGYVVEVGADISPFAPNVVLITYFLLNCSAVEFKFGDTTHNVFRNDAGWADVTTGQISKGCERLIYYIHEWLTDDTYLVQGFIAEIKSVYATINGWKTWKAVYEQIREEFGLNIDFTKEDVVFNQQYVLSVLHVIRNRPHRRMLMHFLGVYRPNDSKNLELDHPWAFLFFADSDIPNPQECLFVQTQLAKFVDKHRRMREEFHRLASENDLGLYFKPSGFPEIDFKIDDELPKLEEYKLQTVAAYSKGIVYPFFRYENNISDRKRWSMLDEWAAQYSGVLFYPFATPVHGLDMSSQHDKDDDRSRIWQNILRHASQIFEIEFLEGIFVSVHVLASSIWSVKYADGTTATTKELKWKPECVYVVMIGETETPLAFSWGTYVPEPRIDNLVHDQRLSKMTEVAKKWYRLIPNITMKFASAVEAMMLIAKQVNATQYPFMHLIEWTDRRKGDLIRLFTIYLQTMHARQPYILKAIRDHNSRMQDAMLFPSFQIGNIDVWLQYRSVVQFLQFSLLVGTNLTPDASYYDAFVGIQQQTKMWGPLDSDNDSEDDEFYDAEEDLPSKNNELDSSPSKLDEMESLMDNLAIQTSDNQIRRFAASYSTRIAVAAWRRGDQSPAFRWTKAGPCAKLVHAREFHAKLTEILPEKEKVIVRSIQNIYHAHDWSRDWDPHATLEGSRIYAEIARHLAQVRHGMEILVQERRKPEHVDSVLLWLLMFKKTLESSNLHAVLDIISESKYAAQKAFAKEFYTKEDDTITYHDDIVSRILADTPLQQSPVHIFYWLAVFGLEYDRVIASSVKVSVAPSVLHVRKGTQCMFQIETDIIGTPIWFIRTIVGTLHECMLEHGKTFGMQLNETHTGEIFAGIVDNTGHLWLSSNSIKSTVFFHCVRCNQDVSSNLPNTNMFRCTWSPPRPGPLSTHVDPMLYKAMFGSVPENDAAWEVLQKTYVPDVWNDVHSETNPFPTIAHDSCEGSIRTRYHTEMIALRYSRLNESPLNHAKAIAEYRRLQDGEAPNKLLPFYSLLMFGISIPLQPSTVQLEIRSQREKWVPLGSGISEATSVADYIKRCVIRYLVARGTPKWQKEISAIFTS